MAPFERSLADVPESSEASVTFAAEITHGSPLVADRISVLPVDGAQTIRSQTGSPGARLATRVAATRYSGDGSSRNSQRRNVVTVSLSDLRMRAGH